MRVCTDTVPVKCAYFNHTTFEMQRDIRADATGKGRAELLAAVMHNAVHSGWRFRLVDILSDLDEVLAARSREIAATSFNPEAALSAWESAAGQCVLAVLQAVAPLVAPVPTGGGGFPHSRVAHTLRSAGK